MSINPALYISHLWKRLHQPGLGTALSNMKLGWRDARILSNLNDQALADLGLHRETDAGERDRIWRS